MVAAEVSSLTNSNSSVISNPNSRRERKDPSQRIFVGRSLRLEKIKFYGFDMDYTLANYKSPEYENLLTERTLSKLVDIGYPEELKKIKYDPTFAVRGLWFDTLYGNLLKVDGFGNILIATHGTSILKPAEIEEYYPNKFIKLVDNRIIVLNTLFNMTDTYILAKLVDYYDTHSSFKKCPDHTGVIAGDLVMTYKSISQDVTVAVKWVHESGGMKAFILKHIEQYIHKSDEIRVMLQQLRAAGATTFLLTNSEYSYTHGVMTYIAGLDWPSLFDISIVEARKPYWFAGSSVFRQVDVKTGTLKVGIHAGPLKTGCVYAGGSCDAFRRLAKMRGKDVLYVGDHIFGDVLRSKKSRGWRTFLVIPELNHELTVWTERHVLFEQLAQLDVQLGKLYNNLSLESQNEKENEIRAAVRAIRKVTHEMDQAYGFLGSLFRSGSRTTFFATQVERYADIYSSSCYNLVHYPKFYFFRAPMLLLPHESTVDHLTKMRNMPSKVNANAREMVLCHEAFDDEVSGDTAADISSARSIEADNNEHSSADYVYKGT